MKNGMFIGILSTPIEGEKGDYVITDKNTIRGVAPVNEDGKFLTGSSLDAAIELAGKEVLGQWTQDNENPEYVSVTYSAFDSKMEYFQMLQVKAFQGIKTVLINVSDASDSGTTESTGSEKKEPVKIKEN